ncbi:MAG: acyl-CoA desaturase [Candidatus Sericytochromatia bacterium]|nr:acyl-CoA desaturase [Candidatus Sericytochromatia bacterium]
MGIVMRGPRPAPLAEQLPPESLPTLANLAKGRAAESTSALIRKTPLNPIYVAWIIVPHVLGLAGLALPWSARDAWVALAMYLWMGFSVTLYLHRYLTHRGFEMKEPLGFLFAMGSAVGLSGDPVGWVSHHRHHHKASDTENDLHSPRHGLLHAHMKWFLREPSDLDDAIRPLAEDCRRVPYLRWLERPGFFMIPHVIVAAALYAVGGLPLMLHALYLPWIVMSHHTYAINSLTHKSWFGYRRFETTDDSVNAPLLILSLGEGWHNNHHAHPRRASHGLAWYEIDATKMLLWVFERFRLVRNVHW